VGAFSALIACVLLVLGVRWWRSRGERARGLHMELSQRSSPRLGGAIMLDGSLDPEWDEADEAEAAPHWPSESGRAAGGGGAGGLGLGGGELSEHEQQMIELEEAIGAGLSGNYSDDFEQLHLDEREFRDAMSRPFRERAPLLLFPIGSLIAAASRPEARYCAGQQRFDLSAVDSRLTSVHPSHWHAWERLGRPLPRQPSPARSDRNDARKLQPPHSHCLSPQRCCAFNDPTHADRNH